MLTSPGLPSLLQDALVPALLPWTLNEWELPLTTVARAGVVLLVTLYLARRVRHWFERATARTKADANTRLLVGRFLSLLVLIVGAATIMDELGIPLSAIVTLVGVIGLAISLALQDILKNFFAGLYLLFERPFRLGDVIAVKGEHGIVETIGIRTTTLRTDENVQVLIPNMTVFAEVVANRTEFKPKQTEAVERSPVDGLETPPKRTGAT